MLFNSYFFILFFLPLVLCLYYGLHKFGLHQIALLELIAASFIFYAWGNPKYLILLIASIICNWLISLVINKGQWGKFFKKFILLAGIMMDVAVIFYFKYFDFFIANINHLIRSDFQLRNIILPLGISFFTFQQISYLVDTYKGETKDYHFIEYAAFVSFFPQLVAGPIVMHSELIPQFKEKNKWKFCHENFGEGIFKLSVGLAKKVLIADTFGKAVTWGWGSIDTLSSMELILVMLSYTFQIYFDFSGYCDMALGIGKLFNFELPINFNSPYMAQSIIEFWEKWHMTLTRFLRNYIYIPLGGNRKGTIRGYINILIVFLISGIWHGANWTFILWGGGHGIAQVLNKIFEKTWNKCNVVLRWICTFTFVNFMWLIFRSENVSQAMRMIQRIVRSNTFSISDELAHCFFLPEIEALLKLATPMYNLKNQIWGFYMWAFMWIALFICINTKNLYEKRVTPSFFKAVYSAVLLVWSIISFSGVSEFLYFNF